MHALAHAQTRSTTSTSRQRSPAWCLPSTTLAGRRADSPSVVTPSHSQRTARPLTLTTLTTPVRPSDPSDPSDPQTPPRQVAGWTAPARQTLRPLRPSDPSLAGRWLDRPRLHRRADELPRRPQPRAAPGGVQQHAALGRMGGHDGAALARGVPRRLAHTGTPPSYTYRLTRPTCLPSLLPLSHSHASSARSCRLPAGSATWRWQTMRCSRGYQQRARWTSADERGPPIELRRADRPETGACFWHVCSPLFGLAVL